MARNAPYTKELRQPEDSSTRTLRIQRRCTDPFPYQKPFPYAVQTGTGILTGGISMTSVGNPGSCGSNNQTYSVPPPGYSTTFSGIN